MSLNMEVVQPSAQVLSQLQNQNQGSLEYNSISSYYTSVNSTNAIVNFNLGLSKCLGAFFNIIPSQDLNNYRANGYATLPFTNSDGSVAKLKQVIFTRGGVKFPNQFDINTNVKTLPSTQEYLTMDPQVIRQLLMNFVSDSDLKNLQFSPITTTRRLNQNGDDNQNANGGSMFAVGTSFDSISNQGVDFGSVNFGIQMEVDLTTDFPQTLFLFVRNKNTLVFNRDGLQVIS